MKTWKTESDPEDAIDDPKAEFEKKMMTKVMMKEGDDDAEDKGEEEAIQPKMQREKRKLNRTCSEVAPAVESKELPSTQQQKK